jgi:hypothetical protein
MGHPVSQCSYKSVGTTTTGEETKSGSLSLLFIILFLILCHPMDYKEVAGPPVQGITTNLTTDLHTSETYEAFPPNIDPCQVTQATLNFPPEPVYILVFCLHTIQDRHTIHNH